MPLANMAGWLESVAKRIKDRAPLGNPHDPGQVFVKAAHLQPVQVDKRRLGTKLSPLGDETVDGQISYTRKIRIGVGKCADSARGHPPTSTSQTRMPKISAPAQRTIDPYSCQMKFPGLAGHETASYKFLKNA
jgi:hypothetical protein